MTTSSLISEQLRRESVVPVESTIPPEMTIEQWRRCRLPAVDGDTLLVGSAAPGFTEKPKFRLVAYLLA